MWTPPADLGVEEGRSSMLRLAIEVRVAPGDSSLPPLGFGT